MMRFKRTIFFLFIGVLTRGEHAFSQEVLPSAETLAESTKAILSVLQSLPGILDKGRSFHDLSQEVASIRYVALKEFSKPDGANRWSGFYDPVEKIVYFNPYDRIEKSAYGVFALHESLGALGIDDVDYQISLPATVLAQRWAEKRHETVYDSLLLKQIFSKERPFRRGFPREEDPDRYLSVGGVDVVGGGGDSVVIAFKLKFMEYMEKNALWSMGPELRNYALWYFVAGAPIEASTRSLYTIQYETIGGTGILSRVYLPRSQVRFFVRHGDRVDNTMVADLSMFFKRWIEKRMSEKFDCGKNADDWLKTWNRSRRWVDMPFWRFLYCRSRK